MHGKQSQVRFDPDCPLFRGCPETALVGRYHSLAADAQTLPECLKITARTEDGEVMAVQHRAYPIYGVQFHPEVTHTVQGRALLNRFVLDICKCSPDWIMGNYAEEAVAKIREQVGDEEVILGLSGGVDSSVAAALIHRAIGTRLTCVFVDNGLLRKNEREQVRETFERTWACALSSSTLSTAS